MSIRPWSALFVALGAVLVGPASSSGADPAEVAQRIDSKLEAATGAKLGPAASDEVFLRRVWLDLTGRVPSALEARSFLDDRDPARRVELVKTLVQSDEFARQWGATLARWLTEERPIYRDNYDGRVLAASLAESVRNGEPWPKMVRTLLTENGVSDTSGPANLLLRYDADPIKLAGGLGKTMMGVTIQCAQCHDHPFAAWRQEEFWGVAALFARVKAMNADRGEPLRAIADAKRGELTRPDPNATPPPPADGTMSEVKQVQVKPQLPGGKALPISADRRKALADWLTSSNNPYLGRNLVNRLWGELMGQPLVRNFDDLNKTSEARTFVDALTVEFAAGGYDLKSMVHAIVLSKAYAQGPGPSEARFAWACPTVRPLSVDSLYASISRATGVEADQPAQPDDEDEEEEEGPSIGAAAHDLAASSVETEKAGSMMMKKNDAEEQFERTDFPVELLREQARSLQRTLVMMNSGHLNEAVRSGARVARALHGPKVGAAHVDWAFLSTVSRRPSDDERKTMMGLLRDRPQDGLEDLYWVLLNSAEFQTNH